MSFQPLSPKSLLSGNQEKPSSNAYKSVQIPGYEIECEIGHGGMAVVYRAVQLTLDRQVAIKVLAQEADNNHDFVQRFEKEGHFLARMLHTNIITIYDIGMTEENQLFLSVEYLAGGTLKSRIKQGLSLDSAIEIIKPIASALAYTHERGVIHRDVKPSNIMFRQDGTPVLTDFGIARSIGSVTIHTMAGLTIGSPGYMSPEQIVGETITIQSDLYSLGVVFYEMLTGHPPYEGGGSPIAVMLRHLHDPIPELPSEYAHLQPIFNRLLMKKTEDRYKKISDFLRDLNLAVSGNSGSQTKLNADIHNISLAKFASKKIQYFFEKKLKSFIWIISLSILMVLMIYIFKSAELINEIKPNKTEAYQQIKNVAKLLEQAESQLQAGQLTSESEHGSAENTYRQVLRLDLGNEDALQGLQNIASEYEKKARQQLENNDLQGTLDQIHRGLAVVPGHNGLVPLYDEVKRRIDEFKARKAQEEEREQRLLQAEQFMIQARDSFQEGNLNVSLVYIEQGLLAAPTEQELLALREQIKARMMELQRQAEAWQQQQQESGRKAEIARRKQEANDYLASALESQRQGEYTIGLQHIEKGLALVPDHGGLIRLRGEVREQFAEEQKRRAEQIQREQEIKKLLERAEAQLAAKRLTQPIGDNAEETYRQLLKLDPNNAQTQVGLRQIAGEYERLARQRREIGALQDSLTLIDRGLAVEAKHEGLSRLRQEVSVEWQADQRKLEQNRKEQERQRLEQQKKEQQRLEQQRKQQQHEEQQQNQRRKEEQRKDQQLLLEKQQRLGLQQDQQHKEPPRVKQQPEPQSKEPPPEKPSPPETTAKPRVFINF